jgi:predicted ester cyclase
MTAAHLIIREYYTCFNERRFADAADLFTADASIEHAPFGPTRRGPAGYIEAAEYCVGAFPDVHLQLVHVEQHGDTICEVDVIGTGTHVGDMDMGSLGIFKATGRKGTLKIRELLEIRGGKITYSSVHYDMQDLIAKKA